MPYHLNYKRVSEIAVTASGKTELLHYLLIFGTFIFIILYYLKNNNQMLQKDWFKWLICLAVLLPLVFIIKFQILILLVPLIVLAYTDVILEKDSAKQFISLIILVGALVSLFAELFYMQDTMNKSVHFRYNTIFKLYIQIWILWGIAASYAFYNQMLRKKFVSVACVLILMMMIFPIFVTFSLSNGFKVTPTLDMERSIKKEHPFEYESIEWLRTKKGTPVVLQASGYSYSWNSYVSAFSGLPTILGWEWHEYQFRMDIEEINRRRSDVEKVYISPNYEEIKNIINKYNITYIYVGPIERDRYNITNVFKQHRDKFKLVFKNRDVEIYEVQ